MGVCKRSKNKIKKERKKFKKFKFNKKFQENIDYKEIKYHILDDQVYMRI